VILKAKAHYRKLETQKQRKSKEEENQAIVPPPHSHMGSVGEAISMCRLICLFYIIYHMFLHP
jgi:hypothetical protein